MEKKAIFICFVLVCSATRGHNAWLNVILLILLALLTVLFFNLSLSFAITDLAERPKATRTETSANPCSEGGKRKAVEILNKESELRIYGNSICNDFVFLAF